MKTTNLFPHDKSQAAQLPKEFRFEGDRVYIKQVGNAVVLLPINDTWKSLTTHLSMFTDDLMVERQQPPTAARNTGY